MKLLAAHLRELGHHVLTVREPGSTPIGDKVRAILLDTANTDMLPATEFLLFSASRAQLVGQVINSHLAGGGVVLCDRFADSSLAYQGYGYGRDLDDLRAITRFATGGLVPSLTLYFDVPVEVGLQRKAEGDGDAWNRMEQKEIEYHQRVRDGYLNMARAEPDRWTVLDATHDVSVIQATVRELVLARLDRTNAHEGGAE
jgi:dTMP kinase